LPAGDKWAKPQTEHRATLLSPGVDVNQSHSRAICLHLNGHRDGLKSGGHRGELQMSDLVVIAFPTEAKAEEVRQKLLAMQKDYLIELGDAVIAVKDDKGNIKLNQMINTTAV